MIRFNKSDFLNSKVLATIVISLISFLTNTLNAQILSENVHRIVFLGNSITYAGGYVNDVEAYFLSKHPELQIEFINVGLPSETVSGLSEPKHAGGKYPRPDLHERLARVLSLTKPDLVFACYGMNDGIYLPFDSSRFQLFKKGIQWLHQQVEESGARIVHVTPPVYDELKGKKIGYAAVLDKYADWLLAQKKAAKWEVADVHYPMKNYLEAHRKIDSTFGVDGFALAADGVHPGEVGHWIMAKSILLYLGQTAVAKAADIMSALDPERGERLMKLVATRQATMKDAWLTASGHIRPGMKIGLPLDEAKTKIADLTAEIKELIQR